MGNWETYVFTEFEWLSTNEPLRTYDDIPEAEVFNDFNWYEPI